MQIHTSHSAQKYILWKSCIVASSKNTKQRFQSLLLVVSRCWLWRSGPWSRRDDDKPQRLCSFQKFKCEWELDVSILAPTAPYTTVRPTNERAATPQTFLMTFIPPHFPSTETHPPNPTSPWWLSFTPTRTLLLALSSPPPPTPNLLSAVRHQAAPGYSLLAVASECSRLSMLSVPGGGPVPQGTPNPSISDVIR